jgi:hypothetical protein
MVITRAVILGLSRRSVVWVFVVAPLGSRVVWLTGFRGRAARGMMGNLYTIADIAIFPWVRTLVGFYEAADLVGLTDFPHVTRALGAFLARPAVIAGLEIPKRA